MASRAAAMLLVALCTTVLSRSRSFATAQSCSAGDLAALRGFSAGLDAGVDGWPTAANASDDACCDWPGVTCDESAAGVVGLALPNRTLRGQVSASLAGLAALRVLNLSGNALHGTLPAALLRLRTLVVLDVSANALAGALLAAGPSPIDLPSLHVFNVSYNAFNGTHPVLTGARNLTAYDVSGNGFAGAVDAAALCAASPAVRVLRLSMNRLSGAFPAGFGQCRSLVELSLDGNGIDGVLPDDLFGVTSLQFLSLHTNSISGGLSPLLRNLSSLVRLDFSFNALSGPLPDVFDALAGLQELSAPSNRLSGELPATLSRCHRLRLLNLRNNSFVGDIGLDFRALRNLVYLDLGANGFTGPIPESLPECRGMAALNLGRNNLTGEIPASFANFSSLSFLSLTGNSFSNVSSALRTLQSLPNLTSLVLTRNFHGGEEMPSDDAGIAGFPSIQVFVIANCELHGEIPSWIAGLRKLRVLDLSWNRLAGPIPPWLGQFDRLFYLDISNNSLQGEIPGSFTRMPGLVASGAHGGGGDDDEAQVHDFPFFMRRNTSVQGRQYNQVDSFPPSLVLGHNNLTGGVPAGLGALTRAHIVDLSWNRLSGPIPPDLSGMTSLESLDLSNNALSGAIPASLTQLSFLSHFDVSYNNLSGEVPVGGQFSTFSRADFQGNPLLCGIHVARCARKDEPPRASDGGKQERSASAGVVAAISVATALLVAVAAAVTWRVWSKRQEDNARVAADDDDDSGSLESAAKSTLVLLFPAGEEEDSGGGDGDSGERTMTLEDVMKATRNFDASRIVGCGGFGMVYRATLADGSEVAVKRLSGDFWQMEREFRAEVETLSRVRHRNLVLLQGYCRAGKDRLLIYPYMENGSLDHWLHERGGGGGGALAWPARLGIARGAARGLAHLHASSEPRVLHRDIKSSNILLDARLEPRLADFGLARLVLPTDTHVTTDLVGTLGYIPPEYGSSSVATYRGDVYSLGVVLLELVTGRRPVDMARPVGGGRDVTSWAVRMRREARGDEVIDASVGVGVGERRHRVEAARVLDVACACVSDNPKSRPTAQQVVEWLDAVAASTSPAPRATDTEHTVIVVTGDEWKMKNEIGDVHL